jgi:probable H4MPT-linked C1 transfer pathway protein
MRSIVPRNSVSGKSVLALDIGGANLKAAHSDGRSYYQPFDLWKNPAGLAARLGGLIERMPRIDFLAVTMTGELCDCFPSKRTGVNAILDAVETAAPPVPIRVWQSDGRLVDLAAARAAPLKAAAANWLALATYAGRHAPYGSGLVVDIGSTTTDIIPLIDGRPVPQGLTDTERLRCQELLYMGVRRTPVCALLGAEGAAEWFATTLDVYVVLGNLPENDADRGTADGRPATRSAAFARLARMIGGDLESCSESVLEELARAVAKRQVDWIHSRLEKVSGRLPGPLGAVVTAGSGEFLAHAVLQSGRDWMSVPAVSLSAELGEEISKAACAYALMVLAMEQRDG